jgi:hypothetical protein
MSKDGAISAKTAEFISQEMLNAQEYKDFLNPYFTKLRGNSSETNGGIWEHNEMNFTLYSTHSQPIPEPRDHIIGEKSNGSYQDQQQNG